MLIPLAQELKVGSDLLHQARRFRVIFSYFSRNTELLFAPAGLRPEVDSAALAVAFSAWREQFEACRHLATINRADFIFCAAGLMLKQLMLTRPLANLEKSGIVELENAKIQWPEGYAYTNFCLALTSAILQDMPSDWHFNQKLADDPMFWNSFRENAVENVSSVPGFFDLLCGIEPNWNWADFPQQRPAMQSAVSHRAPHTLN